MGVPRHMFTLYMLCPPVGDPTCIIDITVAQGLSPEGAGTPFSILYVFGRRITDRPFQFSVTFPVHERDGRCR
jgi:hypothetical protein